MEFGTSRLAGRRMPIRWRDILSLGEAEFQEACEDSGVH